MKFLPVLEKGDTFRAADGSERVVWKVVTILIDTEGQQHDDAKECPKAFAHDQLAASGWELCFSCGQELETFNALTSDCIRTETP
jgi:hypothetical protein